MAEAPLPRWYNLDGTLATQFDAGHVDAGSKSFPDGKPLTDPDPDPSRPCTFEIWNNRKTSGGDNDNANTVARDDMTNVTITALSLVRDGNGDIDDNLSYLPTGIVADSNPANRQIDFQVIFYDGSNNQWGNYDDTNTTWQQNVWRTVAGDDRAPVVSVSGVKGTLSGATNDGTTSNTANFARVKMRISVKPSAPAGKIEWITRVSYSYGV